jgi:hypothetical protein
MEIVVTHTAQRNTGLTQQQIIDIFNESTHLVKKQHYNYAHLLAHTKKGCNYYYNDKHNMLCIVKETAEAIKIINVIVPDDRSARAPAPVPPQPTINDLRHKAHMLQIEIQQHAHNSPERRELGHRLLECQQEIHDMKEQARVARRPRD